MKIADLLNEEGAKRLYEFSESERSKIAGKAIPWEAAPDKYKEVYKELLLKSGSFEQALKIVVSILELKVKPDYIQFVKERKNDPVVQKET